MSNTPPQPKESASRNSRIAPYHQPFPFPPHPGMPVGRAPEMDYSSGMMLSSDRNIGNSYSRQHLDGFPDSQREVLAGNVARAETWTPGKEEVRKVPHSRDDEALYRMLAEEINNRNMSGIKNLLNQGLDVHYKMRDGNTPYTLAANTGDHDVLRCLQKYSADPAGRNFIQKQNESPMPAYSDPNYHSQSRVQAIQQQTRDHSGFLNPQLTSSLLYAECQRLSPYTRPLPDRTPWPFPFDTPKIYPHTQNYPMTNHMGHTGSVVHPMAPGHMDPEVPSKPLLNLNPFQYADSYRKTYSPLKYDKRPTETDFLTMHKRVDSPNIDKYSCYPGNYSMFNSTYSNSSHSAVKTSHHPSGPSKMKLSETSIIDLTDTNSPEIQVNSSVLPKDNATKLLSGPPPLMSGYGTHSKDHMKLPHSQAPSEVRSWEHGNTYNSKNIPNSSYPLSNSYPQASVPPYVNNDLQRSLLGPTLGLSQPNYQMQGLKEQIPYNMYENSPLVDTTHISKNANDPMAKLGQQWVPRYLTPPPQPQFTALEPHKRTDSPLKSKTLPQPSSDLTFNYPESNKPDLSQPTVKYPPPGHERNIGMFKDFPPYPNSKAQQWMHKDDSKLTPYENHLLDTAARECKTKSKLRLNHYDPMLNLKAQKHVNQTPPGGAGVKKGYPNYPPYNNAIPPKEKVHLEPCTKGGSELPRNSVIKSAPKISNVLPVSTQDRVDPTIYYHTNENTQEDSQTTLKPNDVELHDKEPDTDKEITNVTTNIEEPNMEVKNPVADTRLETEGSSEAKTEDNAQEKDTNIKNKQEKSEENASRKRKLSPSKEQNGVKKQKSTDMMKNTEKMKETTVKDSGTENLASQKISRRPRRSGDMEEFYYDWFSDDESENDNSSDEDYSCPVVPTKVRPVRSSTKLRTTRRMTSTLKTADEKGTTTVTSDAGTQSDRANSDDGVKKLRRRRTRRENKLEKRNKEIVKMQPENDAIAQNPEEASVPVFEETENKEEDTQQEETKETNEPIVENEVENSIVETSAKVNIEAPPTCQEETKTDDKNKGDCDEKPLRKKRKYTRRLDKDGLPYKKVRQTKVAEDGKAPRKKKKYKKSAKYVSDSKDSDLETDINKDPVPNVNGKILPGISPALVELYTNNNEQTPKMGKNEKKSSKSSPDKSPDKTNSKKKSPKRKRSKDVLNTTKAGSVALQESVSTEHTKKLTNDPEKLSAATSESAPSEMPICKSKNDPKKDEDKSPARSALPVKIRKKPGPKPGWKRVALDKQKQDGKEVTKKVRKPRKPKGDGLPRFGMRKRGWNKNKNKKAKLLKTTGKMPGPLSKEKPTGTKEPIKRGLTFPPSEADKRSGRQCFKNKRLADSNFLDVDCLDLEADHSLLNSKVKNRPKLTEGSPNQDVNKISEELQSQEYEFDFKSDSFLYNNNDEDDQPCTSSTIVKQESFMDSPTSPFPCPLQSLTPTLFQDSPLPPNFKKLWCNSAIGETQLHKAARYGLLDNLLYYLERGSNVNQCDNAGYTALHEACVHNHLEAAMLLLQYGADVNKNAVDGTRPFHDAVEYDHIEMARLMLASGADPLLNKFSGRAVMNMIHSKRMGSFIQAYLKQLKEPTEQSCEDKEMEWEVPCSVIFDKVILHGYNLLDDPPSTEDEEQVFEFEMYDKPPLQSYLLQTEEDSERTNFYLLDDYLKATENKKGAKRTNIRIHTITRERFMKQIWDSQIQRAMYEQLQRTTADESIIELVAIDKSTSTLTGAEIVCVSAVDRPGLSEKTDDSETVEKSSRQEVRPGTFQSETEEKQRSPEKQKKSHERPDRSTPDVLNKKGKEQREMCTNNNLKNCPVDDDTSADSNCESQPQINGLTVEENAKNDSKTVRGNGAIEKLRYNNHEPRAKVKVSPRRKGNAGKHDKTVPSLKILSSLANKPSKQCTLKTITQNGHDHSPNFDPKSEKMETDLEDDFVSTEPRCQNK